MQESRNLDSETTPIAELLDCIEEGDVEGLIHLFKTHQLPYETWMCQTEQDMKLRTMLFRSDNQALKNFYFQMVLAHYETNAITVDDNKMTLLHHACLANQVQYAEQLIAAGLDVNAVDVWNRTPLFCAAETGHEAAAECLLKMGANPTLAISIDNATPLHVAAKRGYLNVILKLLASLKHYPQLLNLRMKNGATALYLAATKGDERILEMLGAFKADYRLATTDGETPLYVAAKKGHYRSVCYLLDTGADPNQICSETSSTPLFIAAQRGFLNIVEKLLDCDADVNQVSAYKCYTPLHAAAARAHLAIVRMLLARGANPNQKNADGDTAMHFAAESGHSDIVRLLLDVPGIEMDSVNADESASTPLFMAVENGDLEVARMLVAKGAFVSRVREIDGATPLHAAVEDGHEDIFDMLAAAPKANFDLAAHHGCTLLVLAVNNRRHRLVDKILALRPHANLQTDEGALALAFAATKGDCEILRSLLNKDVHPDLVIRGSDTPLYIAASLGHVHVVRLLLERGANPNLVREDIVTPLFIATQKGYDEIVRLLLTYGANPNLARVSDRVAPLCYAAELNRLTIVQRLVDVNGINVDQAREDGQTPFIIAMYSGNLDIARLLLSRGANPNPSDAPLGMTPLYRLTIASTTGNLNNIATILRENPALINQGIYRDNDTALHMAAFFGDAHIVNFLLQQDANINQVRADGATPLSILVARGHYRIALLLLERGADFNFLKTEDFRKLKINVTRIILNEEDEEEKQRWLGLVVQEGSRLNVFFKAYSGDQKGRLFDSNMMCLLQACNSRPAYPVVEEEEESKRSYVL